MEIREAGAAISPLFAGLTAMTFLPKLHEVSSMASDEQMTDLRIEETMFVMATMGTGLLAAFSVKSPIPFGLAALMSFVVLAVYEGKAQGYAFS